LFCVYLRYGRFSLTTGIHRCLPTVPLQIIPVKKPENPDFNQDSQARILIYFLESASCAASAAGTAAEATKSSSAESASGVSTAAASRADIAAGRREDHTGPPASSPAAA